MVISSVFDLLFEHTTKRRYRQESGHETAPCHDQPTDFSSCMCIATNVSLIEVTVLRLVSRLNLVWLEKSIINPSQNNASLLSSTMSLTHLQQPLP